MGMIILGMAERVVQDAIKDNKVVVFSKSYCPFCTMAKDTLNKTGVQYKTIELEERGGCLCGYILIP